MNTRQLDELDNLLMVTQVLSELLGECPEGLVATKKLAVVLGYVAERQKAVLDDLH